LTRRSRNPGGSIPHCDARHRRGGSPPGERAALVRQPVRSCLRHLCLFSGSLTRTPETSARFRRLDPKVETISPPIGCGVSAFTRYNSRGTKPLPGTGDRGPGAGCRGPDRRIPGRWHSLREHPICSEGHYTVRNACTADANSSGFELCTWCPASMVMRRASGIRLTISDSSVWSMKLS